ncbi:MAG: outer membrane lipoprotein carrier protein LolA [Ignavibacteriales bacterium]|jgi:outer membrane lipoprotein-sorting protein|nr:outer membrane lipoprotein carrier protein LolA [Ignavibacteriales bacterium]MBK7265530.1 outer membrane lipoprotein carrier protein LolA [Ignavibacteriales bacterium]MBP7541976.1 outer membrane lipoprotein carrier protein LolA [Ignavibacteriaceae bacterium]MBP9121659.1 outer membrane lipoprotein carrier protein LolA [Ignavibacteriaceae bacterium]MCC6636358.1 outer membrane lipoprotein carrier protein LolA [Ignavibacteriaceae bacterium]
MKTLSTFVLTIILVFTGAFSARGQVIKSIQKKFNSLTDISATYSQYNGSKLIVTGTFSYKKVEKVRLSFGNNMIVSDGVTNWNIDKKQKKVIISKFDKKSVSILSVNHLINVVPGDCDIVESQKDKVVMTPKKGKMLGFRSVEITKDSRDLISSIKIEDNAKNIMKIDFSGYLLNKSLPDADFSYKPTGDYKVVDLR